MEPRVDLGIVTTPVLIVGGTGRSGTTLLGRIFANHSRLADVPETRYLIDPDGVVPFLKLSKVCSPFEYDRGLRRLSRLLRDVGGGGLRKRVCSVSDKLFGRSLGRNLKQPYSGINMSSYSPSFSKYVSELTESLSPLSYSGFWAGMRFFDEKKILYAPRGHGSVHEALSEFLGKVYCEICTQQNTECFLEKNTWNILYFDSILELIPGAKLVHIKRDPRDVVASFVRQPWMPSDVEHSAVIVRDLLNRWEEVKGLIDSRSYLEVELEELVRDNEDCLRRICEFWNISFEPSLLEIPLSAKSIGRWKQDLVNADVERIERILESKRSEGSGIS